jgi:hypothetical protein
LLDRFTLSNLKSANLKLKVLWSLFSAKKLAFFLEN